MLTFDRLRRMVLAIVVMAVETFCMTTTWGDAFALPGLQPFVPPITAFTGGCLWADYCNCEAPTTSGRYYSSLPTGGGECATCDTCKGNRIAPVVTRHSGAADLLVPVVRQVEQSPAPIIASPRQRHDIDSQRNMNQLQGPDSAAPLETTPKSNNLPTFEIPKNSLPTTVTPYNASPTASINRRLTVSLAGQHQTGSTLPVRPPQPMPPVVRSDSPTSTQSQ